MHISKVKNISGGGLTVNTTTFITDETIYIEGSDLLDSKGKHILRAFGMSQLEFYDIDENVIPNTTASEKLALRGKIADAINDAPISGDKDRTQYEEIETIKQALVPLEAQASGGVYKTDTLNVSSPATSLDTEETYILLFPKEASSSYHMSGTIEFFRHSGYKNAVAIDLVFSTKQDTSDYDFSYTVKYGPQGYEQFGTLEVWIINFEGVDWYAFKRSGGTYWHSKGGFHGRSPYHEATGEKLKIIPTTAPNVPTEVLLLNHGGRMVIDNDLYVNKIYKVYSTKDFTLSNNNNSNETNEVPTTAGMKATIDKRLNDTGLINHDLNATIQDTTWTFTGLNIYSAPQYFNATSYHSAPLYIGADNLLLWHTGNELLWDGKIMADKGYVDSSVTFTNQYNSTADADSRTAMSPLGVQGVVGHLESTVINPIITDLANLQRGGVLTSQVTNKSVGWKTIAVNTGGRSGGKFIIAETSSGNHQYLVFYAAHMYGQSSLNVLMHECFSSNLSTLPVTKIRMKSLGTYDGCALQVYISDATNILYTYVSDNPHSSGWHLGDYVDDGTVVNGIDPDDLTVIKNETDLVALGRGAMSKNGKSLVTEYNTGYLTRGQHNKGYLEGGHNNISSTAATTSPIYSIGESYRPNETTLGNMYGIGFAHAGSASYLSELQAGLSGWGLYVCEGGEASIFLNASTGTIHSTGAIYEKSERVKDLARYNYNTNVATFDPRDAQYGISVSPATGYIQITLPVSTMNNTMLSFDVHIYTYGTDSVDIVTITGYTSTGSNWHNVNAVTKSPSRNNYQVRFVSGSNKIAIGTTTSTWAYPKVWVKNVHLSHTDFSMASWFSGWSVTISPTLTGTVEHTILVTLEGAAKQFIGKYIQVDTVMCKFLASNTTTGYLMIYTPTRVTKATEGVVVGSLKIVDKPYNNVVTATIVAGSYVLSSYSGAEYTMVYITGLSGLVAGTEYYVKKSTNTATITIE